MGRTAGLQEVIRTVGGNLHSGEQDQGRDSNRRLTFE